LRSSPVAELRLAPVCRKTSTIRCCAVAAFARVARQIPGCSPTTSYLGELLDERRAVMEVEMVMTCSRKGPQTQFTPEFVLRLWGDRKTVAKSTGFLAALSQFSLAALSQQVPNKCWAATGWGDRAPAIPTSTQRQLRAAAARAGASGQRPRGHLL
jgi:hypothetical protein